MDTLNILEDVKQSLSNEIIPEEFFAFVMPGEGILAFRGEDPKTGEPRWFQMIGGYRERMVKSLIPIADSISAREGKPYRILKYRLHTKEGCILH